LLHPHYEQIIFKEKTLLINKPFNEVRRILTKFLMFVEENKLKISKPSELHTFWRE
jgi:hypothetical protein